MLRPVKFYVPFRLDTSVEQIIELETYLPVAVVLEPRFRFLNKAGFAQVRLVIDEIENDGLSADPLYTGTFTTNRVTQIVNPAQVVWESFSVPYLSNANDPKPTLKHTIKVKNLAAVPVLTDICSFVVFGLYEEVIKPAPPTPTSVF